MLHLLTNQDERHNTSAPAHPDLARLWSLVAHVDGGDNTCRVCLVPISPHCFVTAAHVAPEVGSVIISPLYRGRITSVVRSQTIDACYCIVDPPCESWVEVLRDKKFSDYDSLGQSLNQVFWVSYGPGGGHVHQDSDGRWSIREIKYGTACQKRWALNYLTNYTDKLWMIHWQGGTGQEAMAAPGDSGAPAFVKVWGKWYYLGPVTTGPEVQHIGPAFSALVFGQLNYTSGWFLHACPLFDGYCASQNTPGGQSPPSPPPPPPAMPLHSPPEKEPSRLPTSPLSLTLEGFRLEHRDGSLRLMPDPASRVVITNEKA